jgi:NIMA (never in mitosis gene a)-related kinase
MSLKDFEILCKLGDGAYSSVYKVRRLEDGQIYALKRVKMVSLSAKEKENALNEIRILASVHHPNVIGYKQAFIDEASKSLWYYWVHSDSIVMEFASNGDLAAKIARHIQQGTPVPEETIWNIFINLVKGLKQLH